jgi:hypothetical protein
MDMSLGRSFGVEDICPPSAGRVFGDSRLCSLPRRRGAVMFVLKFGLYRPVAEQISTKSDEVKLEICELFKTRPQPASKWGIA